MRAAKLPRFVQSYMSNVHVSIDRRIQVVDGSPEQRAALRRVSDIRDLPFVVLLGEPGIGKSTVFEVEAGHEGVPVIKVRALMTGTCPEVDATLFLDALDEYRSDGQRADKAYNLARTMTEARVSRWRLSCRSEDWRKDADIEPIKQTTGGAPIVVAQLLPLDHDEAASVLATLGEPDPAAFLAKAAALGATGFIESPLSLTLLRKAVADGDQWPSTRFELFSSAVGRLAYERNDEHKWRPDRTSPEDIIAVAGEACLVQLISGARALWRSNDEPPSGEDARAFLPAHTLQLDARRLKDMLDTALFRGEGEAFEPIHRTVAEFLAGQALARAVVGSVGRAALPLSRAMALITGQDSSPPTELRGLYAWFAAHLVTFGDVSGAVSLIENDAVTVLAYGDAAVFDTVARRAILQNLDREDPYFRASEFGVTAVGGLAGEDLASDFEAVLRNPPDGTHRLLTVFDVLTSGRPVATLRPLLRSLALDPTRPGWQRWRAADAWLNGADDVTSSRRALFENLAAEPVSGAREALRTRLAAALPSEALSVDEIKSVIADVQRIQDDRTGVSLYSLLRRLEAEPRPELFDVPIDTWLPKEAQRRYTSEVDNLLNHVLAASIRTTDALTAERLWRWTINVRDDVWSNLGTETAEAVAAWLDTKAGRDVALFAAILASDETDTGPWFVGNTYTFTTRRSPSAAIIRDVLDRAAAAPAKADAARLLEIAVHMVRRVDFDESAYWDTYERVAGRPNSKRLLKTLTYTKIEPWRWEQNKRKLKVRREEAKQKAANIKALAPVLDDIRIGLRPGPLDWAAELYFRPPDPDDESHLGVDRVSYFYGEATAAAILEGWEYLATIDFVGVDAAKLGAAVAEGRRYYVEYAAIAGLDRLIDGGRLPDLPTMPIALAIAVLKSGFIAEDNDLRTRLERWAIDRLNVDPQIGASQLVDFWSAALNAGATQLDTIWQLTEDEAVGGAVALAIDAMLRTRPAMAPGPLRSFLCAAAKQLDLARIQALAEATLARSDVAEAQRTIWGFVAFALDPLKHGESFEAEHNNEEGLGLFSEQLSGGLIEAFGGIDGGTRINREAVTIRLLGRVCPPDDDPPANKESDAVRRAIGWLTSNPERDAGIVLAQLSQHLELERWRSALRHACAQQARLRRDREFTHPAATTVRAALAGGPPINAADLRAIVMEELARLRRSLRTADTTPWKHYWNRDSYGKPTEPLVENECRDLLLERLRDRLASYHIAAAQPEARRAHGTRADMLVLTGIGRNLPVEAKRHFHRDIWSAAATQLQRYTADEGADGFGIYLVFWFGNDATPTPSRPDGSAGPMNADEMKRMLVADLSPELRARTEVIVFDVSRPDAPSAKPLKKRTPKGKS